MTTASWSLQRAIHSLLTTDATLLALLGGPHVYDHVPREAAFPYVTFGQTTERDWSTGGHEGNEHIVTLHAWSQGSGRLELQDIVSTVRVALHHADLVLSDHRLINLRHEFTETRRDPDGDTLRGLIRFRAVTEPL